MGRTDIRIPTGILKFHAFIGLTSEYMTANSNENGLRLGWTIAEINQWATYKTTDDVYYPKWIDKIIRNTDTTNHLKENISNCRTFDRTHKLIDRIASSPNAVLRDYEVFNIHEGILKDKVKSTPTAEIKETVEYFIKYVGGGRIIHSCRPNGTVNKSHIPEGADGIEIRCKVGDPAPTDPDNTEVKYLRISTSATVTQDFGSANVGKKAYLYYRWVDLKNPHRNGPWTLMITIAIP